MSDIVLNDGRVLDVKINFLTIKMIGETKLVELQKKLKKDSKNESLQIIIASKMVYIVLRSSGLMITEDEALMLVPIDDTVIFELFKQFEEKMSKFKKKQGSNIQQKMK